MAWWGKLVGGAFGFMVGGPLGALLGGALGHQFDRGINHTGIPNQSGSQERIQTAFFTATFSVMGCVAKVDGQVTPQEIRMAEAVMSQMRLNPDQRKAAINLFNQGKMDSFDLNAVVIQFRHESARSKNLHRMFLEIQVQAALADGGLDPAEKRLLLDVAGLLGFTPLTVARLIDFLRASADIRAPQHDPSSDYKTLGVPKSAGDAEVKKAYRRLMNQHHPDKLIAKGMPEEMVSVATEKTQQIKAAYDRIRSLRK